MSWWEGKDVKLIADLDNSFERGVTQLVGRFTEHGWEYAVVFWRFHSCTLVARFANGELLEGGE